jgi:hypothetical protein
MLNCIYLYLYQISEAEVELNRYEIGRTRVSRNYLSIGVFVPHKLCDGATRVAGRYPVMDVPTASATRGE